MHHCDECGFDYDLASAPDAARDIVAGAGEFYGGADQVQPDPDQPALNGFGEGERETA